MRESVRFRVTALATGLLLVVLIATGVALVASQRRQLTDDLEDAIAGGAGALVATVEAGDPPAALGGFGDDDGVAQVVRDGEVVAATANLEGRPPIAPAPTGNERMWRTLDDLPADDSPYRVLSVHTADGSVVHVGGTVDDIDESIAALVRSLAIAVPSAAVVLALVIWWLVGRTLRPVEEIRREVERIGAGQLARRVPEPGSGDEIDRLARTMNQMLARVETAVDRQQQFVADASHELRTPLARMRAEIEVDQAHPDAGDLATTHASLLAETVEMQRLVEDLLHLARADAGAARRRDDLVDLDALAGEQAARLRAEGGSQVDGTGITAAQVRGDAAQLGRALTNVVDNAARHARGRVALAVRESDGWAEVVVSDDGPGIPAAERARIFERFTRLDEARSRGAGGFGLGLAIAKEIVERHGGTIAAGDADGPGGAGARVVIRLPAATPSPD